MRITGVSYVILAALFWGLSGGIADILMERGWDPVLISFYRGVTGFLFFFVWFLVQFRYNKNRDSRFFFWSVLAGIGVAGNFTLYYLSIEAAAIAVAATLMYTAPAMVLLISVMAGYERATWLKGVCIGLVLLGIVLLTGSWSPDAMSVSVFGLLAGLGAGLSYAVFIFGFKNAVLTGRPQTALTLAFFSFSVIVFFLIDHGEAVRVWYTEDALLFILIGVLGAGLSFILYLYGIRYTAPTTASMVAMVEPVTASAFGAAVIGQSLSVLELIGMGIILVTVTLLSKTGS
ncbi:DMT family transporter [Salisediminibacterium selenitireducens]|uniref:EamA domain-containing protein n=1 Tax=Bacillus selenitireducens (strain ATCC 700615 / DSM 15326 / MLS10) TaxID=439292 RepID=D6Y1I7_BACIE|nr:DMT family transporter [Salisediminibacterium selenitireducens]ADI00774.1 protein of unknown function DUF6 transmembrane [[Bacillus] selenitireducens MLS10]